MQTIILKKVHEERCIQARHLKVGDVFLADRDNRYVAERITNNNIVAYKSVLGNGILGYSEYPFDFHEEVKLISSFISCENGIWKRLY